MHSTIGSPPFGRLVNHHADNTFIIMIIIISRSSTFHSSSPPIHLILLLLTATAASTETQLRHTAPLMSAVRGEGEDGLVAR
mmetsp:Transcript_29714/g.46641  ORF Transcript_29714/g.46641 Transcript_29714/m.46641 type:complete len:82 (-) Transcript_29714:126-371(-)